MVILSTRYVPYYEPQSAPQVNLQTPIKPMRKYVERNNFLKISGNFDDGNQC